MRRTAWVISFVRVGLWAALVLGVSGAWLVRAQQPAQQPGAAATPDDPRFTGLSTVMEAKDLGVSRRRFEAGARSAWHYHASGQLLFVEQGRARTQKRGQPMREMGVGRERLHGREDPALARRGTGPAVHPGGGRLGRRHHVAGEDHRRGVRRQEVTDVDRADGATRIGITCRTTS